MRIGSDPTIGILEKLVSFPTVSADGNADLIGYVASLLREASIPFETFPSPGGDRSSLFARVGPATSGGIVLSGHTDVVPVHGQEWTTDPFSLVRRGSRLFGRGTADMKGFLACAIDTAIKAVTLGLREPLYLAFSYDEEVGCVGVRPMLAELARRGLKPRAIVVGEPTGMRLATGHKGKIAARAICCGTAAHSALAPTGLNAIHLAADFLGELRSLQDDLAEHGPRDSSYDIPYSTVHAGMIAGGTALNIVPDRCTLDFEIRNVAADDPKHMLDGLFRRAGTATRRIADRFPGSGIRIEVLNEYPGLNEDRHAETARFLPPGLHSSPIKVAFGTEGGLYRQSLGSPVLVCGPGHMAQGHKADEYVDIDQIQACGVMLRQLTANLKGF